MGGGPDDLKLFFHFQICFFSFFFKNKTFVVAVVFLFSGTCLIDALMYHTYMYDHTHIYVIKRVSCFLINYYLIDYWTWDFTNLFIFWKRGHNLLWLWLLWWPRKVPLGFRKYFYLYMVYKGHHHHHHHERSVFWIWSWLRSPNFHHFLVTQKLQQSQPRIRLMNKTWTWK